MEKPLQTTIFILILHQFILLSSVSAEIKPEFYYNTIRHGGSNGGVLLTLKGKGFAKNQFNFGAGNEHLGNKVVLASDIGNFPCDIHPDGNTEIQITCYTRPMPQGRYHIRISVDGELIPDANICGGKPKHDRCSHYVWDHYTPLLNELTPISGPPGSLLTLTGRIYTSRYGANVGPASNGRQDSILRIYSGGNLCELKDLERDEFYGVGMTSYNWGYMKCKLQGNFVGSFNITFLISGSFGRSEPKDELLKVSSTGKIYVFQSYAEILSVHPKEGSIMGGTLLTIKGKNFDETTEKARVFVGNAPCIIEKPVTDDTIVCRVAPAPAALPILHPGNRGLQIETWTENVGKNINNLFELNSTSPSYNKSWIDKSQFRASGEFGARIKGFFQPLFEGKHLFQVVTHGYIQIRLSVNESEAHTRLVPSVLYLKKSQRYYIDIAYINHRYKVNDIPQVLVHSDNSSVNRQQTGLARDAKQEFKLCIESVKEIQVIKLDSLPAQASVDEIQELRVSKPVNVGEDAMFKLIFGGTATVPLSSKATPLEVQKALADLPMIPQNKVAVTANFTVNSAEYFILLKLDVGNLPLIEVETIPDKMGNNLTVNVASNFNGTASNSRFAFYLDNVMSPVLSVDASARVVKNALDEMFSVRCQSFITAPNKNTIFRNDFELPSDSSHNGLKIYDRVPFCGKGSVKNPNYIFWKGQIKQSVYMENYPTMCAAFRGDANINLEVKYLYRLPSSTSAKSKTQTIATYLSHIEDWKYICFDILKSVQVNGAVLHLLESINIKRISTNEDLYMDSIILTKISPQEESQVLTKAMVRQLPPLSNRLAVKDLQVTKLGSRMYQITLESYNCTDNLPLFQTLPNKLTSNGSESVTTIPAKELPVGVWRLQAASPPLGGSFRVHFLNEESDDIPVWTSKKELEYYLEAMPNMGDVNVDTNGDCICKTYTVEWISKPGEKKLLTLNTTNVTGINLTSSIKSLRRGGYRMQPIPGEHFRTIHKKPQVTIFINGISTALASGGDASFEWKMAATPNITDVSPPQAPLPVNLTITGTGFNNDKNTNNVTIDGQPCKIMMASTTQIVCTLYSCSSGAHDVIVVVDGKGTAQATGSSVQFSVSAKVLSMIPDQGSYEGGTPIIIKGYGFNHEMVVKMNEDYCEPTAITSSEIKCITPAQKDSSQTRLVQVKVGNKTEIPVGTNFTYTSPVGNITQVNVSMAKVTGGEPILLTGTNLDSSTHLEIGQVPANIVSTNSTNVLAIMPAQEPGVHDIHLTISNGYAAISGPVKSIDQSLFVSNINPDRGSLLGGTRLTITGKGFDVPSDLIKISVGPVSCKVEDFSDSWIKCMIEHTAKTHDVMNPGIHPEYKQEKIQKVFLKVGDSVRWIWSVPIWLKGTAFHVYQIDNLFSQAPSAGGFNSGKKLDKGAFIHQFTRPGTYYFWGGAMDLNKGMRGMIHVKPLRSHSEVINVTVGNFEAEYRINSTGVASSPPADPCNAQDSPIDACSENQTTLANRNKFNFHFSECSTAIVSSVTPRQLTSVDEIVLSGKRFSTRQCENVIEVGKHSCVPKTQTTSRLTCSVVAQHSFPVGVLLPLKVRVDNRGYALIDITKKEDRAVVLLPHMNSIIPKMGSTFGGTKLTIKGGGFKFDNNTVQVFIGSSNCKVLSVNYTEVVCETLPGKGSEHLIQLITSVDGHKIPATCKVSNNCTFSYSGIITPNATDVSPTNVSTSGVQFTIEGRGFGKTASEISVTIGTTDCQVTQVNHSHIICRAGYIGAGWNDLKVHRAKIGNMGVGQLRVWSHPYVKKVYPRNGSLHGGTVITVYGNGFVEGHTYIKIGDKECKVLMTNETQVQCSTMSNAMGIQLLIVTSNKQEYVPHIFIYATSHTPSIVSIAPSVGKFGGTLTIIGSGFINETNGNTVTVGGSVCTVLAANANTLSCKLGHQTAGKYPVTVNVDSKGLTNKNVMFTYQLSVSGINPSTGSLYGGQILTLTGSGFDASQTKVMICSRECLSPGPINQSDTTFVCITPTLDENSTTQDCSVNVSVGNFHAVSPQNYQYNPSKTAQITQVHPKRGGTRGGTNITITGTGFSLNKDEIDVSIDNSKCIVLKAASTEIVCQTTRHLNSITAKVAVTFKGSGFANNTLAEFTYVDVWSSRSTWGNNDPPGKGEFIIISKGQKILLDTDTPVLKMLLIQGGTLEFEEKDIELKAENILITDGGRLQIGSEEKPFQHKAIITLYGSLRAKELPIYGAKTLAVREGILDLYGRKLKHTWTHLAATANRGDNCILLNQDVSDWRVGDQIVIASTGGRHSQKENEVHTIAAISDDSQNITLTEKLAYQHISVEETIDGRKLEFRAEVGLLSRNVIVRGSVQKQWVEKIEACPDGFNTGEFATQTCFQGRFGEEMGSDEFGAQIMLHAPVKDKNLAIAHLSYVEVTHAGQAFRLGRYPVHFHLNGDMSKSYVRGCAIHHTFNRAINIHGTHRTLVEHNVVYNIMGGAIFLEDGIETENTFQYNLAVFVKPSTSLRNDDVTPASFWITNPNNIVRHNAAAGGSHFGFWYRMLSHPEGPSFTSSVCPRDVPLGIFKNNTAHSFGWFGLWTFPSFTPREGGRCNYWKDKPVVFEQLTAWNCEKGAETVDSGPLQMNDFVLVNNELAGFEGKVIVRGPQYTEDSMLIKNSLIVGRSSVLSSKPTNKAIILPFGNGMLIQNVTFANFDNQSAAIGLTSVDGRCRKDCGGFMYKTSGLKFINSVNKAIFRWKDEMVLQDDDGTLTGVPGGKVVATTGILPPTCTKGESFSSLFPASVCPPNVKFHRFAFNNIYPVNMKYRDLLVVNKYGNTSAPYKFKAATHKEGWMVLLVNGLEHKISFLGAGQVTNISYDASFYQFHSNDYVLVTQDKDSLPDRFTIDGKRTFIRRSLKMPTYETGGTGNWFYNSEAKTLTYLVSNRPSQQRVSYKASLSRSKRSATLTGSKDRSIRFMAFRCFYLNCEPPKDPRLSPPATKRPNTFSLWSAKETWSKVGKILNSSTPARLPSENDNVTIPEGMWVVVDVKLPRLNALHLHGQLEISNELKQFTLNVSYIHIQGGRLILGWEDKPYTGEAIIELRGTQSTPSFPITSGPNLGSSFIGVFGGLDLHGKGCAVQWTRLASTFKVGAKTLTLKKAVDWQVGEEIVVAATGYNAWETETFRISSISTDRKTLTLNTTSLHQHIAHVEIISGMEVTLSAEVGLLTRNIKVIGSSYENMEREMFGARIIAGVTQTSVDSIYVGYIRLSNVEFMHTGQYGWATRNDPRYSVAFHNLGTIDHKLRPTYIKNCVFHHCFSSAIGIYGSNGMTVENNVIHRTIGSGIIIESDEIKIRNNLITLVVCPSVYILRYNLKGGINWPAGIESLKGEDIEMRDNVVAGSERMGYHVIGEYCDKSNKWSNNYIRGALLGVGQFPEDSVLAKKECVLYSGFQVHRCVEAGIYHNQAPGFELEKSVFAENGVSVCPIVIGPLALAHQTSRKKVVVSNTVFVGLTASYDCDIDRLDLTNPNIATSNLARSGTDGRTVGFMWPTFTSGSNNAPNKPFFNIMSYSAISGLMTVENVTFAHFNHRCGNKMKVTVLMTAGFNDDGQHPVMTKRIKKTDVKSTNLVFIQRPNVGKINSADCVDMDCDGLKKALLIDEDGTFVGGSSPVSVFSQSEWEWNGDKRRGLGDFRIPKVMLTALNGSRIPVDKLAPYKGIERNSNCMYESSWQAYKCTNSSYAMLIVESLDEDTETRRLSPVAILGNGYLDLINGPQDHGWCSGYTCRKRLSTFMLLVELGKTYDLYFSSTAPQNLRLHLLNTNAKTVVSIYFSNPNRLDVFDDTKTYVTPKDTKSKKSLGISITEKNKPLISDPVGTNYFDLDTKQLYVTVQGDRPVDIRMTPVIVMKFLIRSVSEDEFFGDQLIRNLALFLEVPAEKVRIVNVVSESGSSGSRKKRSTGGVKITTQIGDPPATSIATNSTTTAPTNSTNSSSTLSSTDLSKISSKLANAQQLNTLNQAINYTVSNMVLTPAATPVSNPTWNSQNSGKSFQIKVPDTLKIVVDPEASYEGGLFKTGPCLRFYDSSGLALDVVGTPSDPWKLKAKLVFGSGSDSKAVLTGQTEISFKDGWANFTTLSISHKGNNYGLEFIVVYPTAAQFKATFPPSLKVSGRPLTLSLIPHPQGAIANRDVDLRVYLKDQVTGATIPDSKWRGHSWSATAVLVMPFLYRGEVKNLGKAAVYDSTNDTLVFKKVSFSRAGVYIMQITVISTPSEYTIVREEEVHVMSSTPPTTMNTITTLIRLMVDINYQKIENVNVNYFRVLMINYFMYKFPNVQFKNVAVSKSDNDKANVHLEISGETEAVMSASKSICNMAENQEQLSFQSEEVYIVFSTQVNGTRYLGSNCGDVNGRIVPEKSFPVEIIIGVAFAAIFLLLVTISFLVWRFQIVPKAKIDDSSQYLQDPPTEPVYISIGRGQTPKGRI